LENGTEFSFFVFYENFRKCVCLNDGVSIFHFRKLENAFGKKLENYKN